VNVELRLLCNDLLLLGLVRLFAALDKGASVGIGHYARGTRDVPGCYHDGDTTLFVRVSKRKAMRDKEMKNAIGSATLLTDRRADNGMPFASQPEEPVAQQMVRRDEVSRNRSKLRSAAAMVALRATFFFLFLFGSFQGVAKLDSALRAR
jgi:hypothetical protein